jgi:hypothetical protein
MNMATTQQIVEREDEMVQTARFRAIASIAARGRRIVFAGFQFGRRSATFVDWDTRAIYYLPVGTVSVERLKHARKAMRQLRRDRKLTGPLAALHIREAKNAA